MNADKAHICLRRLLIPALFALLSLTLVACAGQASMVPAGLPQPSAAVRISPPTARPTSIVLAATAPTPTPSRVPSPSATAPPTVEPEIVLGAVGDIMLARSIGAALKRDPRDSPFAKVAEQLRAADVTIGNLECALGTDGAPAEKGYTFLAPPVGAATLADAGFDLVALANNHSLDFGPAALIETMQLLDTAKIEHVGAGRDAAAAHRPALLVAKGLRLAFLAYVDVPIERNGFDTATWQASGDAPGAAWARPAIIAADVAEARRAADLVIVLLHSGYEGDTSPNDIQRAAAHAAIDAGATLVVGAHPHVLQGVERYGRGIIAYSLGNIVFDGLWGNHKPSAILHVTLSRAGIRELRWTPVILHRGRPQLADGQEAAAILAHIQALSAELER